jgi:hypothetical protein
MHPNYKVKKSVAPPPGLAPRTPSAVTKESFTIKVNLPLYKETQIHEYVFKGDLFRAALYRHWELAKINRRRALLRKWKVDGDDVSFVTALRSSGSA